MWPLGHTKFLRVLNFSTLEEKFRISAQPCNILYFNRVALSVFAQSKNCYQQRPYSYSETLTIVEVPLHHFPLAVSMSCPYGNEMLENR